LTNNYSTVTKKFGLNENKRGKIKESDLKNLRATFVQSLNKKNEKNYPKF